MAQVSVRTEWRWRGFSSGEWAIVTVALDNTEAISIAAGGGAGAIAGTALPPPADVIVPAVLGAYAAQIAAQNHGNGVNLEIDAALAAISIVPHYNVTISSR